MPASIDCVVVGYNDTNFTELLERNDIYSGLWHQQNNHLPAAGRNDKPTHRSPTLVS